jgi:branched-subunit amino acid aminotransferase/4-amino-4-deoxychorismate lyase
MSDFLLKRQILFAEAENAQIDDVLWLNTEGEATEVTLANIFVIRQETLFYPDPDKMGTLAGITQQGILQYCHQNHLLVRHAKLDKAFLATAEGVFLTNALQGLQQVTQIDDIVIPWPATAVAFYDRLRKQPVY